MGMDYSLVQRIIDGLGKILDTKPGSPDEGTYVTEQQLADWIKGQTVVLAYYYNGVMYSDALHTTPITGQTGALYMDQDNNVLYRWDGAAWDAMSDKQLRQDILDGTVVAKKAECDEDGNNIKATYATKVEAANLQSQVDVLDHRVQNLEQAKGSYVVQNYKDGSITPSGKGAWAIVEGLRGVSRVANNLMQYSTGYSQTNQYAGMFTHANALEKVNIVSGHKYLFLFVQPAGCALYRQNTTNLTLESGGTWSAPTVNTQRAFIATAGATAEETINSIVSKSETTATAYSLSDMAICDLTLYFGGTIPSDADTIAEIQTNYPHLLIPSEYGVRIVDSSYSGVRAWARNLWDEQWERGSYNLSTGEKTDYVNNFRNVNTISVKANTTYYFMVPYNSYALKYDADGNYLGYTPITYPYTVFTTDGNVRTLNFTVGASGASYANNICLNVSDSLNGTYTPYHAPDTLSLTFQGKSAGSVYDSCEPNVEVEGVAKKRETTRIGSVDLGTLDWVYQDSPLSRFSSTVIDDIKAPVNDGVIANISCGLYFVGSVNGTSSNDKTIGAGTSKKLYFKDLSKTGADLVNGKAPWLNGVMLNYELNDPVVTLSDPIIDNTLLTESGGRMSTVQTGTVVDGSFDMGFINL